MVPEKQLVSHWASHWVEVRQLVLQRGWHLVHQMDWHLGWSLGWHLEWQMGHQMG